MKEDITQYAKLGLVHHMLFPKSIEDETFHADSLIELSKRNDIEAFDCCLPYDKSNRNRVIEQLSNCGKEVCYALHLFPSRKISLCSLDKIEQSITRLVVADQIEAASAINAKGFVFVSGSDIPENRDCAKTAFLDFTKWFANELRKKGITALLEPFDRTVDKKYLYGPIDECISLIDEVSLHYDNIGIELDMAHLPLMGEDFESSIRRCGHRIKRVHLGNCVLNDTNSTWYGDKHPPICFENGMIAESELRIILETLLDIEYLSKANRGSLVMEMQPYPNKSAEYTVEKTMEILRKVWDQI